MPLTLAKRPKRLRVLLEGQIDVPGGPDDVRVRDISKGGVLVETFGVPPKGDDVILLSKDHALPGSIVWRDGVWLGIKLEDEMPKDVWDAFSQDASAIGANTKKRVEQISDWHERIELPKRKIEMSVPKD